MLMTCWAPKGGSGTTVTTAMLALEAARAETDRVLLLDTCGDLPAVFGMAEPARGLTEWLAGEEPPEALTASCVGLTENLLLLPLGDEPLTEARSTELLRWLAAQSTTPIFADVGLLRPAGACTTGDRLRHRLADSADRSLMVTRACYLSLRRAMNLKRTPHGVLLVTETGRSLGRRDCEHVINAPVVAEIPTDHNVARVVDAGLLRTRMPRHAIHMLSEVY